MQFTILGLTLYRSAQKLLKMSKQLSKVVFSHYEPFDNWVHESGKVVLVGEAAHPIIVSRTPLVVSEPEPTAFISLLDRTILARASKTP